MPFSTPLEKLEKHREAGESAGNESTVVKQTLERERLLCRIHAERPRGPDLQVKALGWLNSIS